MSSPDTDPFLSATPGDVERGIARRLMLRGDAPWDVLARDIWSLVTPVLEAKDKEIARLREQVESVRADERQQCVAWLREQADAHKGRQMMSPWFLLASLADELEAGASAPAVDTGEKP